MDKPDSAAPPQDGRSILAAMAPVVKRAVKFFEVAVLRLSAASAYTSSQMSESAQDCDSSLGQLRPMLLTLQAYADAAAAPRQPEGRCETIVPYSDGQPGPCLDALPCAKHPKSEPEGQDLSEEEIASGYEYVEIMNGASFKVSPAMVKRLLDEVKRHRAQPADAAPLVASATRATPLRDAVLFGLVERWGIIQSYGSEEDGADEGRKYQRCLCCGVIAWDDKPLRHKKKCEVGAALAAAPRDEHRADCAKLRGLAVCVCAAPLGAPDARPDAAVVLQNALYEEGYCERTTTNKLMPPNGHAPGCGDGAPHVCECWVSQAWALLDVAEPSPEKLSPVSAASLEVEALDALAELVLLLGGNIDNGDPRWVKARAVLRKAGRHA